MNQQDAILPGNGQAWNEDARINLTLLIMDAEPLPQGRGNKGRRKEKRVEYLNVLSAFDIETTTLQDIKQSFMYLWQWHFRALNDDRMITVYGRTWEEWYDCAATVCSLIPEGRAMVVLDHNLSYEFQFLREYVSFDPDTIFATDVREVLKATVYNRLEFRCTMRHSNTTLSVYTKQWHVEHQKLSGDEYDYNKIRYPWTPLSHVELLYGLHDVIGLTEAYIAEMQYWKDDLYSVPMTSTGYVRRICKRAWALVNFYDRSSWIPSVDMLELLHLAFRGGDTHASRFHATSEDSEPVINYNVQSWDRASSYPDVLVNCMYPLGDWYNLQCGKEWTGIDEINKYIDKYGKAVLTYVHFKGLRLADDSWEMPYIPKDKALYFENIVNDNGRVLSADFISLCITDVDWRIIREEYTWEKCYFSNTKYCRYRYLPDFFRDVVKQFFEDKTVLKGSPEGSMEEIEYNLKKQLLNALYGMAAQWPIKESVFFMEDTGEWLNETDYKAREKSKEIGHKLSEFEKAAVGKELRENRWKSYKNKAFLPYQVGVWCTAWARLELHRAIKTVRSQGGRVLYCDTDSVKFIGNVNMNDINQFYKKRSENSGAYADNKSGKRYYMGVYDYEYTAAEFATMGAKKYVYRANDNEHLHVTIAGVNKRKGAAELEKKGGISAFRSGTVFVEAGGIQGIYNDKPYGVIEREGHQLYIGTNICLMPDTYTLGMTDEYARLIDSIIIRGKIDAQTASGGIEG